MKLSWLVGAVVCCVLALGQGGAPLVPLGIIPVPAEPGIVVSLRTDKAVYAPGDPLRITFTLSRQAYVYLWNLTADGKVKLLVPNRFLQDPRFPAGEHTLPTKGWVLRVTEPEGLEYLQLLATDRPLPFYEAAAFAKEAFLLFTNPAAFAARLQGLLGEARWGTAWTRFRVYKPKAVLAVITSPAEASVWADGRHLGITPLRAVVAPGKVTVRVEKEGYETRTLRVDLADREEVTLSLTLTPARAFPWVPPSPAGPSPFTGFGLNVGLISAGVDLWMGPVAVGVSLTAPPARPDLAAPGPGGWFPWGPEGELYLAGWLQGANLGLFVLGGVSAQQMAWIPAWTPLAVAPMVEIEPETKLEVRVTFGVGLGVGGQDWKVYLAWHSRRGFVLGFVLGPG